MEVSKTEYLLEKKKQINETYVTFTNYSIKKQILQTIEVMRCEPLGTLPLITFGQFWPHFSNAMKFRKKS